VGRDGAASPDGPLRVLLVLTYYRPHTSGLTIYVERLARSLARRGHTVTVLTSRHDRSLPRTEHDQGVEIVRAPVVARVSKGVVMPSFGLLASRLVPKHDAVSLHLPQLDAAGVALRARLLGRPSVVTYHCDLRLPAGALNRVADRVIQLSHRLALRLADRVVTYTRDYADHSPALQRVLDRLVVIPPPVEMTAPDPELTAELRARLGLAGGPIVGMASRFASEKGIEFLLAAIPSLATRFPGIAVLFAGPSEDVLGERRYRRRLEPALQGLGDRWRFVGTLPQPELPAFYAACDCLVVPSLNSTESFGLVQVEAMLCGTPVVASNLPGVRQPVLSTGMGELATPGSAGDLAAAIGKVLGNRSGYIRARARIEELYSSDATGAAYESLLRELLAIRRRRRG
jgi:glycosyltransferase involved in cell wall biosynthesis